MLKACLALAFFCLCCALPVRAFDWETATVNGRDYVTLRSFCTFYGFPYQAPAGNQRYAGRNGQHSISLKLGTSDMYLDGVHYVMSFAVEEGDHDWLVSRMDVIKLFEPILRPSEIAGRHSIRGVVIDPGHGGTDNGATSRYGAEKNYTLETAYMLEPILQSVGLKTVLTRRTDVFVDLYERAHIASLYPDYAFVSIHFNSATEEARGLETYCLAPRGAASTSSAYLTRSDIQKLPGNDYDTQNILLASMVHSEIIKLNPGDPTADRGVKRARFVVIKQNVLPAILVEGGFVSNRMESARVNRADYRQSLAMAIARGIVRFVNAMGDRDLELPGMSAAPGEPVPISTPAPGEFAKPKPIPTAPVAPSGLAHDPANGKMGTTNGSKGSGSSTTTTTPKVATTGTTATTITTSTTGTTKPKVKQEKSKKTATTPPATIPASEVGPISPAEETAPPVTITPSAPAKPRTPGSPLDLTEPAAPTPTPGADKAPPEPDEPPTVNLYPMSPSSAPAPSAPTTNAPPESVPAVQP